MSVTDLSGAAGALIVSLWASMSSCQKSCYTSNGVLAPSIQSNTLTSFCNAVANPSANLTACISKCGDAASPYQSACSVAGVVLSSSSPSGTSSGTSTAAITSGVITVAIVAAAVVAICWICANRRRNRRNQPSEPKVIESRGGGVELTHLRQDRDQQNPSKPADAAPPSKDPSASLLFPTQQQQPMYPTDEKSAGGLLASVTPGSQPQIYTYEDEMRDKEIIAAATAGSGEEMRKLLSVTSEAGGSSSVPVSVIERSPVIAPLQPMQTLQAQPTLMPTMMPILQPMPMQPVMQMQPAMQMPQAVMQIPQPVVIATTQQQQQQIQKDVTTWSVAQVREWLVAQAFETDVCDIFERNGMDGRALLSITDEILSNDLGIAKIGTRLSLRLAVEALKAPTATTTSPATTPIPMATATESTTESMPPAYSR